MSRAPFPYAGITALITGASTGIGAEFAHELAARGSHLVLVARSEDKLTALATEIRTKTGVSVEVIPADLANSEGVDGLIAELSARGIVVDALFNNAGFGTFGDLISSEPDRIAQEVDLNVGALTRLTTRLLPGIAARPAGAIVNIASNAAFQPIPHMAVYAATKAYVLSFTQALWGELRGTSTRVLAVCPGATETPFFEVAGDGAILTRRRTTTQVVQTSLRALDRGKPSVVDGFGNAVIARLGVRLTPERWVIAASERFVRPRA